MIPLSLNDMRHRASSFSTTDEDEDTCDHLTSSEDVALQLHLQDQCQTSSIHKGDFKVTDSVNIGRRSNSQECTKIPLHDIHRNQRKFNKIKLLALAIWIAVGSALLFFVAGLSVHSNKRAQAGTTRSFHVIRGLFPSFQGSKHDKIDRMEHLISDCTNYVTNENNGEKIDQQFDRMGAASSAMNHKEKWQFGYSTRLAAPGMSFSDENHDELGHIQIRSESGSNPVNRGDLVLLCVHSMPTEEESTREDSDASLVSIRKEEKPFLRWLTKTDGSRSLLRNGHLIVGVMGARYAPDAVFGREYAGLEPHVGLSLLGSGGTYGEALSFYQPNDPMEYLSDEELMQSKPVTKLVSVPVVPIGRLEREAGSVYNIREAALRKESRMESSRPPSAALNKYDNRTGTTNPSNDTSIMASKSIPIFVFTGVSMNSGKSVSMSHFIRGLAKTGARVGAAKATGTDYPKDGNYFTKAGAEFVTTFAEFGVSSTHDLDRDDLDRVVQSCITHLINQGSEVIVLELADGVRAPDAMYLLGKSTTLRPQISSLFVAAQNGLGASAALDQISRYGLMDKLGGVTGLITSSPLAVLEFEALERDKGRGNYGGNDVRVLSPSDLVDQQVAAAILSRWLTSE